MVMINTRCTASFTSNSAHQDALAGNDLQFTYLNERSKMKSSKIVRRGFCLNNLCDKIPNSLKITKYKTWKNRFSTTSRGTTDCPLCHHALYWTDGYETQIKERNAT